MSIYLHIFCPVHPVCETGQFRYVLFLVIYVGMSKGQTKSLSQVNVKGYEKGFKTETVGGDRLGSNDV